MRTFWCVIFNQKQAVHKMSEKGMVTKMHFF